MFHSTRIAFTRYQKWDGDIGVVLSKLDRAAAVIEHSALVLAQAIKTFRGIRPETIRDVECTFPIQLSRLIGARYGIAFAQQILSSNAAVFQISTFQRKLHFQGRGRQDCGVFGLRKLELGAGAGLLRIEDPRLVMMNRFRRLWRGHDMNDGGAANRNLQSLIADFGGQSIAGPGDDHRG